MNKLTMLLTGCAALGLAACSNDDLGTNPGMVNEKPGDVAYLSITIKDANSNGRAVVDGDYDFGNAADEGKVTSAKFLFYDENGVFMTEANILDPKGGPNTNTEKENIEYLGKNTLVLQGLKDYDHYPHYMLTILNAPAKTVDNKEYYGYNFTLDETRSALVAINAQATVGEDKYLSFPMTTTSFFGGKYSDGTTSVKSAMYYVNSLQQSDFKKEPAPTTGDEKPIQVYVERLAAKVTVQVSAALEAKAKPIGDKKGYKLDVTVGGNDNPDITTGGNHLGTELYMVLNGWGLNGIAKSSYISKNLDGWNETSIIGGWSPNVIEGKTGWNHAEYYRSYWGKGVEYGKDPDLTYVTWSDLNTAYGKAAYCPENTNTQDYVFPPAGTENTGTRAFDPSVVTCVLVQGTICDGNGDPVDLIMYNGLFFTKDAFIKYELAALKADAKLEYYYEVATEDGTKYKQVDETCVKVDATEDEDDGVGYVELKLIHGKDKFFTVTEIDGENQYTPVTADQFKLLTDAFKDFTKTQKAMAYTRGSTYYIIPIEHLNYSAVDGNVNQEEAVYGVVRNHWYNITINNLTHIGLGVFEPNEEIIKPDITTEPTYYMGATVNVLSWKLVNQSVDLK